MLSQLQSAVQSGSKSICIITAFLLMSIPFLGLAESGAEAPEGNPDPCGPNISPSARSNHVSHYDGTINHAICYRDYYPLDTPFDTAYDGIYNTPPNPLRGGALIESYHVPGQADWVEFSPSVSYLRTYINLTVPGRDGQALCTGATLTLTTSSSTETSSDLQIALTNQYWDENFFRPGYDIIMDDLPRVDTDVTSNFQSTTEADEKLVFDVTDHVNEWFNGNPNYGLCLMTNESGLDPLKEAGDVGVNEFFGPSDAESVRPRLSIDYIVNNPPDAQITSDPEVIVKEGLPVTLTGEGNDPDGDGIAKYRWESDRDGLLGTTASISPDNLTLGRHKITFKVTDDVAGFPLTSEEKWRFIEVKPNFPEVTAVRASSGGSTGVSFDQNSKVDITVEYKDGEAPVTGWINISDIEGVVQYVSREPMNANGPFELGYQWDSTGVPRGLYRVDVVVKGNPDLYDLDGLYGNEPDMVLNLVDAGAPRLEALSFLNSDQDISNNFQLGDTVTIEVEETNGENGLLATVNITGPEGNSVIARARLADMGEGGKYRFIWNTRGIDVLGTYSVEVSMKDSSGNIGTARATIELCDLVPPAVAIVRAYGDSGPGDVFPPGELLTVRVVELDSEEKLSGEIEIIHGDDTVIEWEPLVEVGNGVYYYGWDTLDLPPGKYALNVTLCDRWGNCDTDGLGKIDAPDLWIDLSIPKDERHMLTVVDSRPAPGDLDVPLTSPIWIVFSDPVDISDLVGETVHIMDETDEDQIEVQGSWDRFDDDKTCKFTPDAPWKEDTVYTVNMDENLTGKEGLPFESYRFSFRTETPPPEVFVPPSSNVYINTSENMTFTVNSEFIDWIDEDGSGDLEYTWILNGRRIDGAEGTNYTYQAPGAVDGLHNITIMVRQGDNKLEKTWMVTIFRSDEGKPGDTDEDGLPDSWEIGHFGDLDRTAGEDTDGDGATNLEELEAGTDPSGDEEDGASEGKALALGLGVLVAILVILNLLIYLKKGKKGRDPDDLKGHSTSTGDRNIPERSKRAGRFSSGPNATGQGHVPSEQQGAKNAGAQRHAAGPHAPASPGMTGGSGRASPGNRVLPVFALVLALAMIMPLSMEGVHGVFQTGATVGEETITEPPMTRIDDLRTTYISPDLAFSADISHTLPKKDSFFNVYMTIGYLGMVSKTNLTVGDGDFYVLHPYIAGQTDPGNFPPTGKSLTHMWWDFSKMETRHRGMLEITKAVLHASPSVDQPELLPVGAFALTSELNDWDFSSGVQYRSEYNGPKYVRYDPDSPLDQATPREMGKDYTWDITQIASKWFDGTFPNYGVIMRTIGPSPTGKIVETQLNNPLGFDGTNTTAPCLEIQYRVNLPPEASIDTVEPETPVEGMPFTISGSATDPDGHGISNYRWEFDYGSIGSGPDITVNLPQGLYTFTLMVWDDHPIMPMNSTLVKRNVRVMTMAEKDAPTISGVTAEHTGVGTPSFSPGTPVTIVVEELSKTTGLVGSLSITGDDPVNPIVVENAPLKDMGDGSYTYDWGTVGMATGTYSVDTALMDPLSGLGDFDGLRPGPDIDIFINDDQAPNVSRVSMADHGSEPIQPGSTITFLVEEENYEVGCNGGLDISGPGGTFSVDLDDMGSGIYTHIWNTDGVLQGDYTVNAWLSDETGNRDENGLDDADPDLSLTIKDTIPPMVASVSARQEGDLLIIRILEINGEEGLEGCAYLENEFGSDMEVDFSDYGDGLYVAELDILDLEDGNYDIEVTLWDETGNMDEDGLERMPDVTFERDVALSDPPSVVSKSPEPDSVISKLDMPISVEFSKPISTDSDIGNAIYVIDNTGARVDGRASFLADGLSIEFEPSAYWNHDERYTVFITPLVISQEDVHMNGLVSWSFSVIGKAHPSISGAHPETGIQCIAGETVEFSVNVTGVDMVQWFVDEEEKQKGTNTTFSWETKTPGVFKVEARAKTPDGQASHVWFVKTEGPDPEEGPTDTETHSGSSSMKWMNISLGTVAAVLILLMIVPLLINAGEKHKKREKDTGSKTAPSQNRKPSAVVVKKR